MATAPVQQPQESTAGRGQATIAYSSYIEQHLGRTRKQVKWVEIATHVVVLLVGLLSSLLAIAIVDHWIMPLGTLGRWICLLGIVIGGGYYAVRVIIPLLLRRVNAVYAALAIEQNLPTLKNSLVNLLLLRNSGSSASAAVLEAVEAQAASRLAQVDTEVHVDRTRLIRLGYVLIGVMALAALYKFVSPKDPLQTFQRVFSPWAAISAPTRVQIARVTPGDTQIFTDQHVELQAVVHNLRGEPVEVVYSSVDEQRRINERKITLREKTPGVFETLLPGGVDGLQESVTYYIQAGDARSPEYTVTVRTPPAITVRQVEYKYPAYTGRERPPSEGGDVQALVGTVVTLRAEANQEIREAWLDLNCDGRADLRMQHQGRTASVSFPLRLSEQPGERNRPEHDSYQIRYVNSEGHENPRTIRYKINVIPDDPPVVSIRQPAEKTVEVPVNGQLAITVAAEDPDFALSRVTVLGERAKASGRVLLKQNLLEQLHPGKFEGQYTFVPQEHKLEAGEEVHLWALAFDNKEPEAQSTKSDLLRIKIVEPSEQQGENRPQDQPQQGDRQQPNQNQQQQNQQNQQGNQDPNAQNQQGGQGQQGQNQQGQNQQGQNQQGMPQEGQPGGQNQQGQDAQGQPNNQQQPGQQQPGAQQQQQAGEPQQNAEGQPGQEPNGQDQPQGMNDPAGQDQRNPMQQPGQQQREPMQGGEQQAGQQQQDQQQQGDQQQNQQNQGQQPRNQQQQQNAQQGEQQGSQQQEGNDPKQDPNKVIEELLKHREQKQPEKEPQQQDQQGGNQNQGNQDQQPPGNKGSQQQQGGQQNSADRHQPGGDNQQAAPQGGDQQAGGGQQGRGQNNPSQQSQSPSSEQSGGADKPDDPRGSSTQKGGGQQQGGGQERLDNKDDSAPASGSEKPQNGETANGEREGKMKSQDSRDLPDGEPQEGTDAQGQGGRTKPNLEKNMNPPEGDKDANANNKGGNTKQEKGAGGAGNPEGGDKGSPEPYETAKPKMGKSDDQGPPQTPNDPGNPQSPSHSKHESDSQGDSSGDRSGGGKDGGGQAANQQGAGTAGQNTAADEGASQAPGSGRGEDSAKAGDKTEADGQTGQSGERAGAGSKSRQGESTQGQGTTGQKPGEQPQNDPNQQGQPQQGQQPEGAPSGRNQQQRPSEDGQPQEGAGIGNNPNGQPGPSGAGAQTPNQPGSGARPPHNNSEPGGEAPNQQYADQATDLALRHLREELAKENPDPSLLERINMSKEEAEAFLRRMEQNRNQAKQPGAAEASNRLQNQGLRQSSSGGQDDALRGLRESGISRPPAAYREEYRSYTERGVRPSRNNK